MPCLASSKVLTGHIGEGFIKAGFDGKYIKVIPFNLINATIPHAQGIGLPKCTEMLR